IRTAAVFVGNSGLGPWQIEEIKAFLRAFVNRKCPVIPVLLPNAPKEPKLPVFLQGLMWVDFREHDPEPLGQLIWGITGIKPDLPPLILKKPSDYQLKTFPFQTAQINNNGTEIQRITKNANYFGEDLGNGVILEMVAIPGGTFKMGSPENEERYHSSQSPQHEVTVPPFFMGKYPVTQQQWRVVAALPKVNIDLKSDPSYFKGDGSTSLTNNLPVERVSWNDAQEFCARLSRMANKTYRLPTEAEWEYACRGGTTTPFYCGETISTDLANYDGNYTYGQGQKGQYRQKTTEVGIFPANPFGLYDMCGNVWEWCEDDWQENYINAPKDGSAWTSLSVNEKLLRGGSWNYAPVHCRSAYRDYDVAGFDSNYLGFRVVCGAAWTH
ncbi:SUMF1/EgtB/PvdO family nonheme iron enzyme, partial [Dolichospermum circinale CS-545/17]|nr:SUMF1/EgtB/PvdO family nonheme iron enzyme [Dolichospermum circinale CS-545/17]